MTTELLFTKQTIGDLIKGASEQQSLGQLCENVITHYRRHNAAYKKHYMKEFLDIEADVNTNGTHSHKLLQIALRSGYSQKQHNIPSFSSLRGAQ